MFIGLLILWIIFNGKFTLEILIFGLILCGAVYAFSCRIMGFSVKKDLRMIKRIPLACQYLVTLVSEILKANRQVLIYIMTPQLQVEPQLVHFKTNLRSETARVILANSITLTPGTITVRIEDGDFWVHCLDKDLAEGMDHSVFVELLEKMEAME